MDDDSASDPDDDDFDAKMESCWKKAKLSVPGATATDPVVEEVERFFNQRFDVVDALKGQSTILSPSNVVNAVGVTPREWIEKVEVVSANFDIMEWWEESGKQVYPLIYPVACCILALPDSNGDQERTFSSATWMDGDLNTKQADLTFQMKVLVYKNTEFLNDHRKRVKEEAKKRTKELLQQAFSEKEGDSDLGDINFRLCY
jgi:hAT family C-terminal dimerisation region